MTEERQINLLDPYRTIGNFISGKLTLSQSKPFTLTVPSGSSFKVYSHSLALKVSSCPFPNPVTAAVSFNDKTYIRTGDYVYSLHYHHITQSWYLPQSSNIAQFLYFQNFLILAEANSIHFLTQRIQSIQWKNTIKCIAHPVTYINKIIVCTQKQISLLNVNSQKVIYVYQALADDLKNSKITALQSCSIVDIVMIALSNGKLLCVNLKKDIIVFSLQQKSSILAIAVSKEHPLMVTSDTQHKILLWDLEQKKIIYRFQCKMLVDSLIFMFPLIVCGSSTKNSIIQLRINYEQAKILTLYRERIGTRSIINKCVVSDNNNLVLSSNKESMCVSFHSQCNNYVLPLLLHSKPPLHLSARNFDLIVYNQQTVIKTFKAHQEVIMARISTTGNYFIAVTRTKIIKFGGTNPIFYQIKNIKQILLNREHSIFVFTQQSMLICDFNTPTVLKNIKIQQCNNLVCNAFSSFCAFQCSNHFIQIWDMNKQSLGRQLKINSSTTAISFTIDNRYLVTAHKNKTLCIYDIAHNTIMKTFTLLQNIVSLDFTHDNQFMISVFADQFQACIWNNYIGKISSNRNTQDLLFKPYIQVMPKDYRQILVAQESIEPNQIAIDIDQGLDQIPDAQDNLSQYSFKEAQKWLNLVYYDQIKVRLTPEGDAPSLPFFLDFRNIDQEKQKIYQQIDKENKEKKLSQEQNRDKLLENKHHQINFNSSTTPKEYLAQFQTMCSLSIAEVDYQLRKFTINSTNGVYLIKMMKQVLKNKKQMQIANVILLRILHILGTDIFAAAQQCKQLMKQWEDEIQCQRMCVDRCVSIIDNQ